MYAPFLAGVGWEGNAARAPGKGKEAMEIRTPSAERLDRDLREPLLAVCAALAEAGGRAWLVGGTVRDLALGAECRDLDVEAFGLEAAALETVLEPRWPLDRVGEAFGILKLKGLPIDLGLPRRESKSGRGHQGFVIDSDPFLDLPTAAARRDFTINSMYLDPLTDELADPWGGLEDLREGILRHTSPAFVEDPLRVLRGMQLLARFDLEAAPATVALCRTIGREGLAAERVLEEWKKLLLRGRTPSRGLRFLRQSGWLEHFPELAALVGVPQDPRWHPEGDVWTHTLHCLDEFAAERLGDEVEDLVVGLAVLCHDLGKPETTQRGEDGRIRALGHEDRGLELTRRLLERLAAGPRLIADVLPLVAEHMRPTMLFGTKVSDAAIRRLALRVGRIDRLVRVARADVLGRPPLRTPRQEAFPAGPWLLERARALGIEQAPPVPIVLGRHLLELGLQPGPELGPLLKKLYDDQIEGKFTTEAEGLERARRLLRSRGPAPGSGGGQ